MVGGVVVVVVVEAGGDIGGATDLLGSLTRAPPLPLMPIVVVAVVVVVVEGGGGMNFRSPGAAGGIPAADRSPPPKAETDAGLENKSSAELLPARVLEDSDEPELGL